MFMDGKTQDNRDTYSPRTSKQLQYNSCQRFSEMIYAYEHAYSEIDAKQKELAQLKTSLINKNKLGGINLPYIEPYYRDTMVKTVLLIEGQTYQSIGQNRNLRNRPTEKRPTDFEKRAKASQERKVSLVNKSAKETGDTQRQKMNLSVIPDLIQNGP